PLRPIKLTSSPAPASRSTPQSTWDSPWATSSPLMDSISRLAPPPEIDLEDARIALDLLHRPLAENRSLVQDCHLASDLPDERHVVLDDEDRPIGGDRLEQRAGPRSLLVGHARDRFVHEEQLGILRDHHADLEPLLLAVRQGAGQGARPGGELDRLERSSDALALLLRITTAERGEDAFRRPAEGELHVVPDGEVHEDGRRLELPPDTEARNVVLAQRKEVGFVAEDDTPSLGLHPPGDDVEER